MWVVIQDKSNKHDKYVLELYNQLKPSYDKLYMNVPVRNSKRLLGEADIIAKKGKRTDIYEVKCSHRITKAKHQAKKLRKNLGLSSKARFYFYCGSSKSLMML